MFQVSDKVVCVDDSASSITGDRPLKKGVVYVVEATDGVPDKDGNEGIWPVGIRTLTPLVGWSARRFRKLSEVKADNALKNAGKELVRVTH